MAEKKRFLLRIDQNLYDMIEKWANDELRSVNAQMELILKNALKEAGRFRISGNKHEK
ncbi:Arc family DNA-binding protein [Neobacillus fumarioli]|uniref:Arc family DNA-binding protein n=1 Tax=Neobacillus fumarioli TaxID=105229 RepID=UPI000A4FCB07|nr:Arc family DNA-binding protein [Neobacillus fumarioli]